MSVEKRARQNRVRNQRNRATRTTLKSAIKSLEGAAPDAAQAALKQVQKNLDRAAHRNVIHKRRAARKLSRLTRRMNKAAAAG